MTRRKIVGLWMAVSGVAVAAGALLGAVLPFGDCPPLLSTGSGVLCPQSAHAGALWLTVALAVAVPLLITGVWLAAARHVAPPFADAQLVAVELAAVVDHQQV